jgi:hypothetical protein
MEAHVGITSVEIVATPQGGFPTDNIGYWKEVSMLTGNGERGTGMMVSFKSGGFIEIPGMTAEQFTSLVYGVPF